MCIIPKWLSDEAIALRSSLTPESDRGCALLAAAYLDQQLERLLRSWLVADAKVAVNLFGRMRPLASFASRIDLAYLCGLIGPEARRDLHLIRDIRNEFGHTPAPLTFEASSVASRCRELRYRWLAMSSRPRRLFESSVMAVLAIIHTAIASAQPRISTNDVEITDEMRESFSRVTAGLQPKLEELLDKLDVPNELAMELLKILRGRGGAD